MYSLLYNKLVSMTLCQGCFEDMFDMNIKDMTLFYDAYEVKWSEVTQSCLTLCDSTDYSSPGSSLHGIFQARVLEWVATSFSRGYSWSRDQTWVSHIVGRRFTIWATREALTTTSKRFMEYITHPSNERDSYHEIRNITRCIVGYWWVKWKGTCKLCF